jgi:PAS domain-containing protein
VRPPDLLLLAGAGPEFAGLLSRLKQVERFREIPIILALPSFTATEAARALELGADEFIVAPFTKKEVLARVAVLLRLQQDRRLLETSQQEFSRVFEQSGNLLFLCDRQSDRCDLNPALHRLLGYPREAGHPFEAKELLFEAEDRERFEKLLAQPGVSHVKVRLRHKAGRPVPVLLSDLSQAGFPPGVAGFQVQPVGAPSSLKRALTGLVEHFLPAARDYLALLQLTPLLGGRFEKIKKLGQGSFGEVWLVLDTEAMGPERHYVAKIPFDRAANPKFCKEATICRRLAPHPGVVGLVDTLEDDGKVVLIQEYAAGRTLADMLGEELPRPLVERLILQLIDVVAHAHRHRIIHRDIKPNNIIVQPDGTLKLLDFGAAKILREKDIGATMIGSRPFMAPEQIMGQSERRSDIWAIGVLMYLLYTGELPFYREVEKLLIDQILEQEPQLPRELNPELPAALEDIILKCLKKNVSERYPQAQALKADLLRQFPLFGSQSGRWPWTQ